MFLTKRNGWDPSLGAPVALVMAQPAHKIGKEQRDDDGSIRYHMSVLQYRATIVVSL